jgi:peptide/nickel transport system substrate-binding protein
MFKLNRLQFETSTRVGAICACLLILVVGCGAAATATPAPKTTAVAPAPTVVGVGASASPTAIPQATVVPAAAVVNPGKLTWMIAGWGNERFTYNYSVGGGNNYARIMHSFLIATNEKSDLLPGIATKWEISGDGKTWTFTIRDGAKFHDGTPITAEDVWWSWMHYWGKDASGSAQARATQIGAQSTARNAEKFEQPAPNQVSFVRKTPDAGFPAYVSEATGVWWSVVPKRPKVHDDAQEAAYDKNPIGAGPMKLVKHVPADLMAFERFDDYYYQPKNGFPEDRRLKFKFLDLRLVPEEATRVAAIRSGEADIAPVSLATRKQVESGNGRVVFGPEGIYMRVMLMGCRKPQFPCYDKRVRQALDLAIDKNLIRDKLYGGPEVFEVKGWAHVTPSAIGYSRDLDPWPQDTARARKLLADAGYPDGKNFGKLIVNTWASTSMPFMSESAQLAAEFWKRELGLDVEVKVGDEATLKKQTIADELDGQVLWRDNEARKDISSNYSTSYGTPGQGGRFHDSQELFDLVNQTLATIDPSERELAYNKLNKRAREESYELGIGYVNIPWAVGSRVTAWHPWPLSFYPSNLHGIVLK